MLIRFLTLLTLLLSIQSVLLCSEAPAGTSNTQHATDSVEQIIQESEKEDNEDDDLVGITVKDTLEAAVYNGLVYSSIFYGLAASRNKVFLKRTQNNAKLFATMIAQNGGSILVYGGLRAATKELTGYDAAPIVQYSIQAIAGQTIGHYMAPDPYNTRIKLFSKNQVASYVATDLTVAASMYAYKEMTGKKLACPKLPIPDALRARGYNEKLVGGLICMGVKEVMRRYVMNSLCGVK